MRSFRSILPVFLATGALQASPLAHLATCSTDAATRTIREHLLVTTMDPAMLEGFTPLIEESLDDWKIHNDKPEVRFTLKDGVISGVAEDLKGNSFLYTAADYENYLLYFEFRFDHLMGNSGLMYHSIYTTEGKFAGLQYEMDPGDKKLLGGPRQWTGLLYAENLGGWHYPNKDGASGPNKADPKLLHALSAEGIRALNKTGWNAGFIRVRGNEIQTWLNGTLRTDFVYRSPNYPGKGAIALQIHGGKACAISWRHLYILPLPNTPAPPPQSAISMPRAGELPRPPRQGPTRLFVGQEIPVPTEYTAPRILVSRDGSQVIQPSSPTNFEHRRTGVSIDPTGGIQNTELEGFINYGTPIRRVSPVYDSQGKLIGTSVEEIPNPVLQPVFRSISR